MAIFCLTGRIVSPRVSLRPYFCSSKKWNQSSYEMTLPLSYLHILFLHVATQKVILISCQYGETLRHISKSVLYVSRSPQSFSHAIHWKIKIVHSLTSLSSIFYEILRTYKNMRLLCKVKFSFFWFYDFANNQLLRMSSCHKHLQNGVTF